MALLAILLLAAAPGADDARAPRPAVSLRASATAEIIRSEIAEPSAAPERVERRVKRGPRGVLIEFT
ncbi:MAG: hypothetical protein ACREBO_04075 [Novosphingobium sp.]